MASFSFTVVFFSALVSAALGNANILPRTLLERIEALESRDSGQMTRIGLLENQALVSKEQLTVLSASNDKLQEQLNVLTVSNEKLEEQLAHQSNELQEQEAIIIKLREDADQYKAVTGQYRGHSKTLGAKKQKTDKVLEETQKNHLKMAEGIKRMKTDAWTSKIKTPNGLTNQLPSELTTNTNFNNKENDISESEDIDETVNYTDTRSVIARITEAKHILPESVNRRRNTRRNDVKLNSGRSISDPVAFHAVHMQLTDQHPRTKGTVLFDTVLLNQGNNYHSHHGLFTASHSGFYLFSTTIMCDQNSAKPEAQVSLMLNGARLARAYCHADHAIEADQGSVTAVTYLNVADEVWVQFDWPEDGGIWGNGFTSFTGILIM